MKIVAGKQYLLPIIFPCPADPEDLDNYFFGKHLNIKI